MKLIARSFPGKSFRPLPEALIREDMEMFAIATPWGPDSQTKKTLEFLSQNYENFSGDSEKTSLFQKLESLSPEENALRSLALSCNEWIFREQNKGGDRVFGYELICGSFKEGKLAFVQAGQPFIYLDRPDLPLQPLGHILDLSALLAKGGRRLAPLPSSLAGLYPDTHFSVFSLPVLPEDRLLFISRDFIPGGLFSLPRAKRNLDSFLSVLTKESAKSPVWLGQLSF